MFTRAITRKPAPNFAEGITTGGLGVPDYSRMLEQHDHYVQALRQLGLDVVIMEPLPDHPDAYFVEDVAVVTPELAVITRPGAPSRLGEQVSIAPVLAAFRPTAAIQSPGTVEGGDVLIVGKDVFIGLSARTNRAGAGQLGGLLGRFGYRAVPVPVPAGLHLKSSVSYAGRETLLVTASLAGLEAFRGYEHIRVREEEEYAANSLLINDTLIIPAGFPYLREALDKREFQVVELEMSEARKMDGGLTCMSLRF